MLNYNLKNILTRFAAPAVALCGLFICIQGCRNPALETKNLLTKSDTLNLGKDTLKVLATSQFAPSLPATSLGSASLGCFNDRNFGTIYGSFYAQCVCTTTDPVFGINPVFDSAILYLGYNGQYGLCTQPINLAVYQLNQYLNDSFTYYTNSTFSVQSPPIGVLNNFVPDFVDSIYVAALGANEAPALRIPLSYAWGNKIFNFLISDSLTVNTDSVFLTQLDGIYVTPTSGRTGNGMIYINLSSIISGVSLYYHYLLYDTSSSASIGDFTLPLTGVTVNHFDNTYRGTPAGMAAQSTNPGTQQKLYIEGGAGMRGLITINLDTLAKAVGLRNKDSLGKKIGINKAELVLTQSPTDTQFVAPALLNLLRIDDSGNGAALDDASQSWFGGVLEIDSINGVPYTRYRFVIPQYFQRLIQGIYSNNGLLLTINSDNTDVDRIVLGDYSTNKNLKLTFVITYTKL